MLLRVAGNSLILEVLKDPIELALPTKFASIKPEEVEAISLEEQARRVEDSP